MSRHKNDDFRDNGPFEGLLTTGEVALVWVELDGKLLIGPPDLVVGGRFVNVQDLCPKKMDPCDDL